MQSTLRNEITPVRKSFPVTDKINLTTFHLPTSIILPMANTTQNSLVFSSTSSVPSIFIKPNKNTRQFTSNNTTMPITFTTFLTTGKAKVSIIASTSLTDTATSNFIGSSTDVNSNVTSIFFTPTTAANVSSMSTSDGHFKKTVVYTVQLNTTISSWWNTSMIERTRSFTSSRVPFITTPPNNFITMSKKKVNTTVRPAAVMTTISQLYSSDFTQLNTSIAKPSSERIYTTPLFVVTSTSNGTSIQSTKATSENKLFTQVAMSEYTNLMISTTSFNTSSRGISTKPTTITSEIIFVTTTLASNLNRSTTTTTQTKSTINDKTSTSQTLSTSKHSSLVTFNSKPSTILTSTQLSSSNVIISQRTLFSSSSISKSSTFITTSQMPTTKADTTEKFINWGKYLKIIKKP